MQSREAAALGEQIAGLIETRCFVQACSLLAPILAGRTPFAKLDRIGQAVGKAPVEAVNAFLDRVATDRTEGGWVIIGSALRRQLACDLEGALDRCRGYVIRADVWYGADILGERVPGPALLGEFERTLSSLDPWRTDSNRWVRRAVGVSVHFWAKRTQGAWDCANQAQALLGFLEPMFGEWDTDAVKGVGWGLKTLGRYYPELLTQWLREQVVVDERRHRRLMLRKAITYLTDEQRMRATGELA